MIFILFENMNCKRSFKVKKDGGSVPEFLDPFWTDRFNLKFCFRYEVSDRDQIHFRSGPGPLISWLSLPSMYIFGKSRCHYMNHDVTHKFVSSHGLSKTDINSSGIQTWVASVAVQYSHPAALGPWLICDVLEDVYAGGLVRANFTIGKKWRPDRQNSFTGKTKLPTLRSIFCIRIEYISRIILLKINNTLWLHLVDIDIKDDELPHHLLPPPYQG